MHDLTGQRFGMLVVVRRNGSKPYGGAAWLCLCDCGNERVIGSGSLRRISGGSRSCGCVAVQKLIARSTTHGLYDHPLRPILDGMKERCYYKKHIYYDRYGGRGIYICDRWLHGADGKTGLECFIEDVGPRPSRDYEIDREDNDGPYSPENVRWIPQVMQARNRSNTIQLTYQGVTKPLIDWAEDLRMSVHALRNRYYDGWPHDKILSAPIQSR